MPYFQLIRVKHNRYGGISGNKLNKNLAINLLSNTKFELNRRKTLISDSTLAVPSNPRARLIKRAVCPLHSAMEPDYLSCLHPLTEVRKFTRYTQVISPGSY